MKTQKKQKILTSIIVIALVALTLVVVYAIYIGRQDMNKEKNTNIVQSESKDIQENTIKTEEPKIEEKEPEPEYVGKEEEESKKEEGTSKSKDEQAISLAKKEWGDDETVTFNVEEKKETKYYVSVKRDASTIAWYEVDTESWEISEY